MVPPEPPPFLPSRLGRMMAAAFSSARNGAIRDWVFCNFFEFLVGVALEEGLIDWRNLAHFAEQNNLACELAFVLIEVCIRLNVDGDRLTAYRPIRRRRPRRCLCDEDGGVGRRHADPGVELLPAH